MSRASASSWLIRAMVLTLLFLASARAALAQTGTATINGQVTDESGAVLSGVTVTATSPALQVPQVVAASDLEGRYRLTPLPIGTYSVTFELAGFRTVRREDIRLTVGFTARVDPHLRELRHPKRRVLGAKRAVQRTVGQPHPDAGAARRAARKPSGRFAEDARHPRKSDSISEGPGV